VLSPRWRKIWGDLRVNKTRTLLVVMSIVVGIFAIGSISGTSAILNREVQDLWQDVDPASASLITATFDESVAEQIEAMPEVEAVQVRRSYDARVQTAEGEFTDIRLFAVPDYENMRLNLIQPERGDWPPAEENVLIERSALDLLSTDVGETLTVELPTGETVELPVTGEAYDLSQPAASVLGAGYGYISMATMNAITEEDGFNLLQFRVAENAEDEAYVTDVANMIRDTLESEGTIVFTVTALPPGEPPGYVFVVALLLVLGVIGSLTFLLSGFLIVNIISALLTQQTKQIGVMKAVGARTGQIIQMYLGMAAAFGLFALLIGLPLSFLGARGLAGTIGDLSNYKITDFSAPWWVFALQIVIGLVVPVLAALIPVIGNTRISVRQALDARGINNNANSLIDGLLSQLRGLPRPVLLSFRNTFRQRGRLTLTLLTLTLAGAIFATVFTVRNSLYATLDEALAYDNYDVAVDLGQRYPADEIVAAAESIEGVTEVQAWAEATGRYVLETGEETDDIGLFGLPPTSDYIDAIIKEGRWLQAGDTNALVVNDNLVTASGDEIAVGDEITFILRGQQTTWEVVGIARAIFNLENQAWTSYAGLSNVIGESGETRTLRLTTAESTEAFQNSVVNAINDAFNEAGYLVEGTQTTAQLESSFDLRFNTLVFGLLALAGLLAVVGGLGIAGTTSINVIERMREIGVMRSIGAADYQVLGIFVIEALIVGIIGWVLGSLLAVPISQVLSAGVGNAFSNAPLTYSFDFLGAGLWLVVALVLALLSSYFPARRASRLTLREVLAYEG
jgi:putative ABC transport system permease protein